LPDDPVSLPPPLLRSPPFPRIAGRIAAVSAPLPDAAAASWDEARIDALFARIREARVGGAFWGTDDPWRTVGTASIHPDGDAEEVAVAIIAGDRVTVSTPGRFAVPGDTPADQRRRVADALRRCRYRDPFHDRAATIEQVIDWLALWRREIDANRDIAVACGMAWWKRPEIARFLWAPRPFGFRRATARAVALAARRRGSIAIWPSRVSPRLCATAERAGTPLVRVEDGFVRSVGLGSNLHPPFSIVVDRTGIHYDPAVSSDLETLLQTVSFPSETIARAERLRAILVERGVGKYGVDDARAAPLPPRSGKRRVLVAAQVEDDLSVRAGGGDVAGNLDLLARARAIEPDADIWFRPHPDVDAGHRKGRVRDEDALRYADHIVRGGGMAPLLGAVDAVHVLTSLTGFEALLRGCEVVVHGSPFYSGWGLTRDLGPPLARRTRRLTLPELTAGVLLLYPRYLDPVTRLPCPAEILVERLIGDVMPKPGLMIRLRGVQGRVSRWLR
jgi:capsular polysaccharide export protein